MEMTKPHEFFTVRGFKHYPQPASMPGWQKHLYTLRLPDVPPCKCNDRTGLHVNVTSGDLSGHDYCSIEIEITAEANDGQWFKLMAYALRPEDLTDERLDDIKRRLIAAWREVYQ
jgi:hypothetical protein